MVSKITSKGKRMKARIGRGPNTGRVFFTRNNRALETTLLTAIKLGLILAVIKKTRR